jgi:hypothetical protein
MKKQSEEKCVSVNLTKRARAFLMGAALVLCLMTANRAAAQGGPATVFLGSAAPFAVLGGSTVTSTGPTIINGDVGVWAGTAYVPGTPAATVNGTIHAGDTVAQHAQASLLVAFNDAAGRTTAPINVDAADLGGRTLAPGLYKSHSSLAITGDLTLNANGNPNAVWIFQVGSALTVNGSARVILSGGATAGNVFWQVGSSATLGSHSAFKGTIMAYASITIVSGATLDGRALARIGAVTLDSNNVTVGLSRNTLVIEVPPSPVRSDNNN